MRNLRLLTLLRSFAAYSIAPAVGLITAPILARSLGVEGRGQLAAILQPLTVADSIAVIGIPTAVAYFIARKSDPRQIQKIAFVTVGATSLLAFGILALYSHVVSEKQGIEQSLLILIWLAVIPGAVLAVRRSAWAGTQAWKTIDLERTSSALSRLAVILGAAVLAVNAVAIFAAAPVVAGLIISSVILWRRFPRNLEVGAMRTSPADLFRFSLLSAFGTIAAAASARLDQAIMPGLATSEQLGIYSVAVTISEVPIIIAIVLGRNLMSEAAAGASTRLMLRTILFGVVLASAVTIPIGATSGWLVPLVFGQSFAESVPVLRVLLAATMFVVVSAALSAVITGWHRPLAASLPQVVSIVIVIFLFSVRGHGITALDAAWIAVISQGAAAVTACIVVGKIGGSRSRFRS